MRIKHDNFFDLRVTLNEEGDRIKKIEPLTGCRDSIQGLMDQNKISFLLSAGFSYALYGDETQKIIALSKRLINEREESKNDSAPPYSKDKECDVCDEDIMKNVENFIKNIIKSL